MKKAILLGATALVLTAFLASGCSSGVSQEDYDALAAELAQTEQELATAQDSLTQTEATLSGVQAQLDALEGICPAGDFSTVSELEDWAFGHLRRDTSFVDDAYRAALKVQTAGLADGYVISVDVDYDQGSGLYYVTCCAVAGNDVYYWLPEESTWDGVASLGLAK
jgi:hypothetical protein